MINRAIEEANKSIASLFADSFAAKIIDPVNLL
jgi:hypothetical protein